MVERIFKTWHLTCETCKGLYTLLEWSDKLPADCACGGRYHVQGAEPRRVFTTNPNVILQDIDEDNRWPEVLGG